MRSRRAGFRAPSGSSSRSRIGLRRQRPAERHPLALPARKPADWPLDQVRHLQHLGHPRRHGRGAGRRTLDSRGRRGAGTAARPVGRSRRGATAAGPRCRRPSRAGRPPTRITPVAGRSPASASSSVVLPAPDGPASPAPAPRRRRARERELARPRADRKRGDHARPLPQRGVGGREHTEGDCDRDEHHQGGVGLPAGLGEVVDGHGQRLCLAGNAAGDDDGRAELAQGAGEAQQARRRSRCGAPAAA